MAEQKTLHRRACRLPLLGAIGTDSASVVPAANNGIAVVVPIVVAAANNGVAAVIIISIVVAIDLNPIHVEI
jgi:hypothetical protein